MEEQGMTLKCPSCGEKSFIVSVFGAICSKCFYEPVKVAPKVSAPKDK